MKKALIAILCAVILLVSLAAAQVALPSKEVKAADLSIAKNVAPAVQANAFGLKADKSQCTCSADTLAKIEQIRKLLSELEQSCMIVENPGRTPPSQPSFSSGECVDKCMVEQNAKAYCEKACYMSGKEGCYDECYSALKVKCENSCNVGQQKPAEEPGCAESCLEKNFNKQECLKPCYVNGVEDKACYDACSQKSSEMWDICQKQCGQQETATVSTQTNEVLNQCSSSCELKYSDCKNSCYASAGNDAAKLKIAEDCTVNTCMPLLKQCSESCNSQYAPKPTIVQKVVNVFKAAQYRNAKWICHDGTESVEGGDTSCKPSDTWTSYAKQACEGKCSAETNKCGVNTFMVYNEC